ncbi:MAG TPA: hypothetical protein VFZ65_16260 [Planctomycetota bacterium]|nr:hypothetical protein [Planctomycetota bacterium]
MPSTAPWLVSTGLITSFSMSLARPKSITFGCHCPSSSATSTFCGFRSRWMTPRWCAWLTPSQAARNSWMRCRRPAARLATKWCSGSPGTYSITK